MPDEIDLSIDVRQFEAYVGRAIEGTRKAAKNAIRATIREAEQALESRTRDTTRGNLWRAWASQVYPKGSKQSDTPAGIIYVNGGDRTKGPLRAFSEGATITGRRGQLLAVPLPGVREGFGTSLRGSVFGLTPRLYERRTGRKLEILPRRGKPSLLVYRLRGSPGEKPKIVPVFILLPQVQLAQRFSIPATLSPYPERLRQAFIRRARRAWREESPE